MKESKQLGYFVSYLDIRQIGLRGARGQSAYGVDFALHSYPSLIKKYRRFGRPKTMRVSVAHAHLFTPVRTTS